MTFTSLTEAIRQIHNEFSAQANRAVNVSLTLRNWLIGFYIREYEQKGADRAEYGARLLDAVSGQLSMMGMVGIAPRSLRLYRQFFGIYPKIWQTSSAKSLHGMLSPAIRQTLSAESSSHSENRNLQIDEGAALQLEVPSDELLKKLSFSHFAELIVIEDDLKRTFYEIECIRGNWSVRELKRQINSLYYERSGLSGDKKKLSALVQTGSESADTGLTIRDPYIFEFLGLKPKEVMSESGLEDQLLDKLQEFLLELGHGFCFEARQKRILIGDTHNFVDMVFYHRVLKCHVLTELKLEEFNHDNIGQLNTYVSWYKKNMMTQGDNPPVGILLCTKKNQTLVEYALAGMDNGLFVSKYQLELPKKDEIQRFIEEQMGKNG